MTQTAESAVAPDLRGLGFEPVPEGGGVILRTLLENAKFTPEGSDGGAGGKIFSFLETFGLKQTVAIDEVEGLWLAQGHVDIKHLGFAKGSFLFEESGPYPMQ